MPMRAGHIRIGPERGQLLVRTFRQGLAATVGHDLTIEVTSWSADITVDGDTADLSARIELGSFSVREGTGGLKPLSDRDRREIVNTAGKLLDVDHHPVATFESSDVSRMPAGGTITGTLTIKGAARPFTLDVTETEPDQYRATGDLALSAFGIKPYSAFFGALKLADRVEIEVSVDLSEDD